MFALIYHQVAFASHKTSFKMFQHWIDRVWTPTVVLLPAAIGVWYLRHLNTSLGYGLLVALTAYWANVLVRAYINERKIDALGGRAASIRSFTPWNVYMLYDAIVHFDSHRTHEWWWKCFKQGNPKNPYTVEAIVVGDRIIFTADEENIKAILATQFSDYGKGAQFRKEWKDFLGLSKSKMLGDVGRLIAADPLAKVSSPQTVSCGKQSLGRIRKASIAVICMS